MATPYIEILEKYLLVPGAHFEFDAFTIGICSVGLGIILLLFLLLSEMKK